MPQIDPQTGERVADSGSIQIDPRTGERISSGAGSAAENPAAEGFWRSLGAQFGMTPEAAQAAMQDKKDHPIKTAVESALGPGWTFSKSLYNQAKQSAGELGQAYQSYKGGNTPEAAVHAITAVPIVGPALNKATGQYAEGNTAGEMGTLLGASAQAAPIILGAADKAFPGRPVIPNPPSDIVVRPMTAVREAALGDPNAAAMKGLHVSPQSPKALGTLNAVEGARPFVEGVQGLQDLQQRIPVAKQEIWQPYQDALDKIGDKQVKGPDGQMTTVAALEDRRTELSAQLRTLRAGGPEAMQLAQQKGLTQANLLREESQVRSVLDPQLSQTGINPVAIRKAFGQVSQIGGRIAGKTTVGEAAQPSGFGRMTNLKVTEPGTWLGEPLQGVRDIAAGRPLWSANPTDLGIREAFRMGGEKPAFGAVQPPGAQPYVFTPQEPPPPTAVPPLRDPVETWKSFTPSQIRQVPQAMTGITEKGLAQAQKMGDSFNRLPQQMQRSILTTR